MHFHENQLTRTVVIVNELGLHARAAARLAELASRSQQAVWLIKDDERADATSVIDILGLACARGTEIVIEVTAPEDRELLDRLAELVEGGFGE